MTICDVANPIVFAPAVSFGLTLKGAVPTAEHITDDDSVIRSVKELRGKAAELVGMCSHWEKVDEESPMLPMVALVAPPAESGDNAQDGDLQSRIFLDNKCHTSMAGTGAICHAACSRIPETVVNRMLKDGSVEANLLNIRHPGGIMPVAVEVKKADKGVEVEFDTLSFVRTARRILKGEIDVPEDMWKEWFEWQRNEGTA